MDDKRKRWPKAVILTGRTPEDEVADQLARYFGKSGTDYADLPGTFYDGASFPDHVLVVGADQALASHHANRGAHVYDIDAALTFLVESEVPKGAQPEQEAVVGVLDGYGATRHTRGSFPHVSVWDSDGDERFTLRVDATVEWINTAIRVYTQGYRRGEAAGTAGAQYAMRKALGLE